MKSEQIIFLISAYKFESKDYKFKFYLRCYVRNFCVLKFSFKFLWSNKFESNRIDFILI